MHESSKIYPYVQAKPFTRSICGKKYKKRRKLSLQICSTLPLISSFDVRRHKANVYFSVCVFTSFLFHLIFGRRKGWKETHRRYPIYTSRSKRHPRASKVSIKNRFRHPIGFFSANCVWCRSGGWSRENAQAKPSTNHNYDKTRKGDNYKYDQPKEGAWGGSIRKRNDFYSKRSSWALCHAALWFSLSSAFEAVWETEKRTLIVGRFKGHTHLSSIFISKVMK